MLVVVNVHFLIFSKDITMGSTAPISTSDQLVTRYDFAVVMEEMSHGVITLVSDRMQQL